MATLDASCPVVPLVPYLSNPSEVEGWTKHWFDEATAATTAVNTVVAAVLLGVACLLLFFGMRLVKVTFFVCGFTVAMVSSFAATNAVLGAVSATPTASCWTLIAVPLFFGFLGGLSVLRLLKLGFACVGIASGAALGYFSYSLVLHNVNSGVEFLSHDLVYWAAVAGLALVGCVAMVKMENKLLMLATAAVGAVLAVPAIAVLALGRIDTRFLWVLDTSEVNAHLSSPFVWSQMCEAVLLLFTGYAVQRHSDLKSRRMATYQQPLIAP